MATQTSFKQVANNAQSTLASNINNSTTSIDVASGHGSRFPTPGNSYYCTIWNAATYADPFDDSNREVVLVTAISTDTMTVTRGQLGTSGVAHNSGEAIRLLIMASAVSDLNTAVNDLELRDGGKAGCHMFTDFMGPNFASDQICAGPFAREIGGTGSSAAMDSSLVTGSHPGIGYFSTGTTTTGYAVIKGNLVGCKVGGGIMTLEGEFYLPDLSTAGEEYDFHFGLKDSSVSAGAPTNGIYFVYDRNSSVNWRTVTKSGGSATTTTTGTAVAEDSWIRLKIEINAAGNTVTFYINGTATGTTHSANIPSTAMGLCADILKSAGTTARVFYVDWLSHYIATPSR
jgi:hypothetical protein